MGVKMGGGEGGETGLETEGEGKQELMTSVDDQYR